MMSTMRPVQRGAPKRRASRHRRVIAALAAAILLTAGVTISVLASTQQSRFRAGATPQERQGVIVTLSPTQLSTIVEGDPTHSFGGTHAGMATIGWNHRAHLGHRQALVQFDLSSIPGEAHILQAWLTAQIGDSSGLESMTAQVSPILEEWSGGFVNWETRPATTPLFAKSTLPAHGGAEWLVTGWAGGWHTSPETNHGLMLVSLADYPEENERTLSNLKLELLLGADDLRLNIEDRVDPIFINGYVEYMLTLENAAEVASLSPTISAQLPTQTRFSACTDGCRHDTGTITWTPRDIPAGESYRVYLTARVAPDTPAGTTLVMEAEARAMNSASGISAEAETGVVAGPTATDTATPTTTATPTGTWTRPAASPSATPTAPTPTPTDTATWVPTSTPTVTPTSGGCDERVTNGGFESFTAGWTLGGETPPFITASDSHSGMFSILLGGSGFTSDAGDSTLFQSVRIPSDASQATLAFWYQVESDENDTRYDWFEMLVLDPNGRLLESVARAGGDGQWTETRGDLTIYAGKTIGLFFRLRNDGNAGRTATYLDDVSLCIQRPGGPEPAATPYPGNCSLPRDLPDYAPAGLPDFSALQDDWSPETPDRWSHDGPAAAANLLWWLDSRFEPGNAPPPNKSDGFALLESYGDWDDHAPENVVPLVETLAVLADTNGDTAGTEPGALAAGLEIYLTERALADQFSIQLIESPSFDAVRDHVTRGDAVMLLIGFRQWDGNDWLRFGGRYLSVAGVSCDGQFIAVSDPLRDHTERGHPGRVWPAPDHPHPASPPDSLHNDALFVSHDIYDTGPIDGGWGLIGYATDAAGIADSLGLNAPAEMPNVTAALNPTLPIAARVEYSLVISPQPHSVSLNLSPALTLHRGEGQFQVDIVARTGNQPIDRCEISLLFDPLALEVVDSNGEPATQIEPGSALEEVDVNLIDAESRLIRFASHTEAGERAGEIILASVRLRPLQSPSISLIIFGRQDSQTCELWRGSERVLQHLHDGRVMLESGATLQIQLVEEGRPPPPNPAWAIPVLISMQEAGGVSPSALFATTADDWGTVNITYPVPIGHWGLEVSAETTLGVAAPWADLNPGSNALTLGPLPEGDANADSHIAAEDVSLLAVAFGAGAGDPTFDPRADFNRDEVIDEEDLALLTSNLGRIGAAANQSQTPLDLDKWDSRAMTAGSVTLTMLPSATKSIVGQLFPISVTAQGFAQEMDTAEIHIDFDAGMFQVVNISGEPATAIIPSSAYETILLNRVDNGSGQIDLVATQLSGTIPGGSVDIATFYVRAMKPTDQSWIRFATLPGRRSTMALKGESILRGYSAMRVTVEGLHSLLPLLYK